MAQVFRISGNDRIAGVLPFFHSFGFTVTIGFPMLSGCGVVYHPNPLDAKAVGALIERYRATFLLATPTFYSHYARKCAREEFASLRYALVGAEKLRDGWYITGDIATVDDAGFVRITDRLARFSKIAGEMVPHLRIEEALGAILGDAACAVTGVPDEQRGERLVALYTAASAEPREVWRQLSQSGLPPLWIPKAEDLHVVDCLPLLGGKLNLRAVKTLAQELSSGVREVG